jgi:hypothetical protein
LNDEVNYIYFLYEGAAGFKLNYHIDKSLIYSTIEEGDEFGSFDIFLHCALYNKDVSEIT